MTFKEDIQQRIKLDFKDSAGKAIELLSNAISETDYLKTDRVIRCIIFLAHGDINNLEKYIDNAVFDTRDVMLWAEYEKLEGELNFKRIRDFNKTFEKCQLN
ncbi:hypothetical protein PY092_19005 [Muricauda sp. 334s03]|uniref:Uncharacterized protein n=1 Tax=Flagellimonas yonaguniensis TaxID=3031325 RepID=A0ABT5Y4J2_9FLAO|nr:hypothetical protein [[Muricauda] yonaguniensis]MDF0718259.1 hypothetical protein [[Muricauda] yonaguniensis]